MKTIKKRAVVVASGGMDSTLCIAIAISKGYEVAAMHLNYGQLTEAKELKAFNDICDYYKIVMKMTIDTSFFNQIGGSSLTDNTLDVNKANLKTNIIPNTYVPFRNGNILALAASWAEIIGADSIFIGAVQQDSSGYPDCRQEFFDAFEKAINFGTKPDTQIKIITPIIDFKKSDIVRESIRLAVPLELTWSCYQNNDIACGVCDSCALRLRGFQEAAYDDPIRYLTKPIY